MFAEAFLHSTWLWTTAASCCCVLYNLCLFEKQTVYHMPRLIIDFSQDSMSRKWNHFATIRHSFTMIQCSDDFKVLIKWQGLTISWSWTQRPGVYDRQSVPVPGWSDESVTQSRFLTDHCPVISTSAALVTVASSLQRRYTALMDTWVATTLTFSLHTSTHALKNN